MEPIVRMPAEVRIMPVSPLYAQMNELLERGGFVLPANEELERIVGFTNEHKAMRAQSFASIADGDALRYIPDEYILAHLTSLGEANLRKYYRELEQDESLAEIVQLLTKNEILELEKSCGTKCTASKIIRNQLTDAILNASTYQKRFLFATRDGIIDLHMRANRKKGAVWRDYFRKAEKVMHMQQICLDIIRNKQIEITLKKEVEQKAIEYNREKEVIVQQAEARLKEAKDKAEAERQAHLKLQAQMRLAEIEKRFMPIKNVDEFYAPNGFLYLEASEDDFKRSVIGFGLTSDLAKRLAQYQSKATGPAKREFLKYWPVWNMNLLEAVIKEVLAPWANPEEKQKPIHKRAGLSKIEIFDMPYLSILNIVEFIVTKFNEITNALKDMSNAMVSVASGPVPEYKPIKDIANPGIARLKVKKVIKPKPAAALAPEIAAAVPARVYIDKLTGDALTKRVCEILDSVVYQIYKKHLTDIQDGAPVSVAWSVLQQPIKQELSDGMSIMAVKDAIKNVINTLSNKIKCVWRATANRVPA